MPAYLVVTIEPTDHPLPRECFGGERMTVDQLLLQRREETLSNGIDAPIDRQAFFRRLLVVLVCLMAWGGAGRPRVQRSV